VDDVLNVAGPRLGTAEIESALVTMPLSPRRPWWATGRGSGVGHLRVRDARRGPKANGGPPGELRATVAKEIGALARPDEIRFADALPKTRSGKIMRRLLRELAASGTVSGDTTTLEDFSVLESCAPAGARSSSPGDQEYGCAAYWYWTSFDSKSERFYVASTSRGVWQITIPGNGKRDFMQWLSRTFRNC